MSVGATHLHSRLPLRSPRAASCRVSRAVRSCWQAAVEVDRKSTRLNSSHTVISYAVFCLKKNIRVALVIPVRFGREEIERDRQRKRIAPFALAYKFDPVHAATEQGQNEERTMPFKCNAIG